MRRAVDHLRLLLGTRLRAIGNRVRSESTASLVGIAGFALLAIAGVTALGHFAAPSLLVAPKEVAVGSGFGAPERLPSGTLALEAAFWLTVLTAAVTSFRAMEILYRRKDVRAVEPYPVALHALFVDRALATALEAALASAGLSFFFVPLIWHGAAGVAGICLLVVFAGLLGSSLSSMAVQIFAGRLNVQSAERDGKRESKGDIYGGPGQIFIFSPGIALAGSAILVLLARLAAGELLANGGSLRAFWFGYGVIGVGVTIAVVSAYSRFVDAYPQMAARFREADAVQYEAHLDYQKSAYSRHDGLERLLPASVRPSYRAAALQYKRGHMLVRYSYVIGWILAGIALAQWSRTAFPPWAVVCAPAAIAATAANPWQRLVRPPLRPDFARYLPIRRGEQNLSALLLSAREVLLLSIPYALLVVWVDWGSAPPITALARGGMAVLVCLALNGAVALAWSLLEPAPAISLAVPVVAAAVLLTAAVVSLPLAATLAALLVLMHLTPLVYGDKPSRTKPVPTA